jgi:hypothetical protein
VPKALGPEFPTHLGACMCVRACVWQGLLTALVGVKGEAHVTEAIEAARLTPIAEGRMRRCLEKDGGWW